MTACSSSARAAGSSPTDEALEVARGTVVVDQVAPTGWRTWPSAILLSALLARSRSPSPCPGPQNDGTRPLLPLSSGSSAAAARRVIRVLELGAGTGLAGLSAALLLANFSSSSSHLASDSDPTLRSAPAAPPAAAAQGRQTTHTVTLSDINESALENVAHNVRLNAAKLPADRVQVNVERLDWRECLEQRRQRRGGDENDDDDEVDDDEGEGARYDVILASDVIYEREHPALIHAVAARKLARRRPSAANVDAQAPRPMLHLVVPQREGHEYETTMLEQVFSSRPSEDGETSTRRRSSSSGRLEVQHRAEYDGFDGFSKRVTFVHLAVGWAH